MTGVAIRTTDATGQGTGLLRWLVLVNLALVALQPVLAGLFMSGHIAALRLHALVGLALLLGAFVQFGAAIVLWRRGGVPAWVTGVSVGLCVVVLLQNVFGHNRQYGLHVPIGVALLVGLIRQREKLEMLAHPKERPPTSS